MKKFVSIIGVIVIVAVIVAMAMFGGIDSLKYQGKLQSVPQVEEKLEDLLEKENPGRDIEVSITDDTDSKKKKKH